MKAVFLKYNFSQFEGKAWKKKYKVLDHSGRAYVWKIPCCKIQLNNGRYQEHHAKCKSLYKRRILCLQCKVNLTLCKNWRHVAESQYISTFFFYIHGSVHRESNLITVQQDATYSVYYISVGGSTCFGCWHPPSGARTTVITASGID